MTDTTITPQEHSLVGGSTAGRRIGCPRSMVLEPRVPKDEGSIYSREGTALHELMARALRDDVEPTELLPFTHEQPAKAGEAAWTHTITEEVWEELGEPALRAFDKFCSDLEEEHGQPVELLIEKRCAMPGMPGAFGTSDVIGRCGWVTFIWDWKFGSHEVPAIANDQLMFYGRAAHAEVPEMFTDTVEVWLCIMQPKVSYEPDVWRTDMRTLENFRHDLQKAVNEAREKGDEATLRKGEWCRFAPCRVICPHFAGVAVELAEKLAAMGHLGNDGKPRLPDLTPFADDLPAMLDMADAAEEWAKALRSAAHKFVDDGGELPGWKLVAKKASGRQWTRDEQKIKQWFSRRGIPVEDYAPRVLITPPAAEKLLKPLGIELQANLFEAKPAPQGTNLVRESSSREAVASSAETIRALGEQLAKYKGA